MANSSNSDSTILSGLVRYGTVSSVSGTTARVYFPDLGMTSGSLPILQHKKAKVEVKEADGHKHDAELDEWAPEVGQKVVCLYLPVDNGDGFVLGVVE